MEFFRMNSFCEHSFLSIVITLDLTGGSRVPAPTSNSQIYFHETSFMTYLVIYIRDVHYEVNIVLEVIGHDPPEDVLSDIIPASLPPYSEPPISRLVDAPD